VALTVVGMFWLAQVGVESSYWTAVASPMLLIGVGQGLVFAPVTSLGLTGVQSADAGAGSGLINSFHQIGSAVGLGVLVAASAHAGAGNASAGLTAHVHLALEVATAMLGLAFVVVLTLLVPALASRRNTSHPTSTAEALAFDADPGPSRL
jgi:hypothetical protein